MEDPIRICLDPCSLVMTPMECFYCHTVDARAVLIEYNYGIKCCDTHKSLAERDCRASMYRNNSVRLSDAFKDPVVGEFFKALPKSFPILRSNGEIEEWALRESFHYEPEFLQLIDGMWSLPVANLDHTLYKRVSFNDFLNPKILASFPENFKDLVTKAMEAVGEIYKKDEELYQIAKTDVPTTVENMPGIVSIILDGRISRILIPSMTTRGIQFAPSMHEPTDSQNNPE